MSIFQLHEQVLSDYRDFVRSFIVIADERAREFVDEALAEQGHLWPEALVQLSPSYALGASVDDLARQGLIAEETARVFRRGDGTVHSPLPPLGRSHPQGARTGELRGHQRHRVGQESLLLPSHRVVRQPATGERVAALVVYPMNALVNSQFQALLTLKEQYERRTGRPFSVRFAKYTGETSDAEREAMRQRPPQILLTNYVMAELLLVRPEDQRFLDRVGGGVRFLMFDELHTYRGRQGADVAMLVRRLKERGAAPDLVHIGTSATMVARREASSLERRQSVADFAARFFGHPFTPDQVVEETLSPFTEGGPPSVEELRAAFGGPLPDDLAVLRRHSLVRWLEYELGIEPEADGSLKRRVPRPLLEVAEQLAEATGMASDLCASRLREVLVRGGTLVTSDGNRVLPFKLHQFIGQGRTLYATLEDGTRREFSLEDQLQAGEGRLFVPIKFCRQCGQDYYHVLRTDDRLLPHPIGAAPEQEGYEASYLMLAPHEGDWSPEQLPEEWYNATGRLKATWRARVPREVWVRPDGSFSTSPLPDAQKLWWQPEPFSLCLTCGEFYTSREREFMKLASLSSEGRSSATTILATSLLRHASLTQAARDKLLTFTDNRQDASLQAGHFNDFVHVALLRAALYSALSTGGELSFDQVAQEVVRASGLTIADIAKNADLAPDTPAAREVWRVFTDLTEYRLYEDLRRGWRVIHPNLEQVGLLKVEYRGLDELCQSPELRAICPKLSSITLEDRKALLRVILDQFRRKLAIRVSVLDEERAQQQLRRRSEQYLNEFWELDLDFDELRSANRFVRPGRSIREAPGFSLGERSLIGRFLQANLGVSGEEYWHVLDRLLDLLVRHGLLVRLEPVDDHQCYQLDAACLRWCLGDSSPPPPDPLYSRRASGEGYAEIARTVNLFFQRFYQVEALASRPWRRASTPHKWSGLVSERSASAASAGTITIAPKNRHWAVGFRISCALRPWNSGWTSRIWTLCTCATCLPRLPTTSSVAAAQVARANRGLLSPTAAPSTATTSTFSEGAKRWWLVTCAPPRLDLANEALLRAHIHAVWLAHVRLPLGRSIEAVIDTDRNDLPLREEAARHIQLGEGARRDIHEHVRRLLATDEGTLAASGWFSEQWIAHVIEEAPREFDRAFDRWRELYRAAKRQREAARAEEDRARTREEQDRARHRQDKARHQLNLLLQRDVAREEGDFYPYRYLASEGFLPGYNFPALPVRAWVPRGDGGEFIARPRFLAIREFAPQNFLYHEGTQWECVKLQAPPQAASMKGEARNGFAATAAPSRIPASTSARFVVFASMPATVSSPLFSTCRTCECSDGLASPPMRKSAGATSSKRFSSLRPGAQGTACSKPMW